MGFGSLACVWDFSREIPLTVVSIRLPTWIDPSDRLEEEYRRALLALRPGL